MKWPKEFIRYAAVGIAFNVFGFLLYVLFTTLGVNPIIYISISYPIRIGFAFYLNKKWSFKYDGRISSSAVRYLISYVICYIMNVAALKYFYEYWGFSHILVQAVVLVTIAPLLFTIQKFWVFKEGADTHQLDDTISQ